MDRILSRLTRSGDLLRAKSLGAMAREPLAILAIKQVAHRLSASFVRFCLSLAFVCVHGLLRFGVSVFRFTARRTAVSKAGLTRLQLELFRADSANFDRKCHFLIMITRIQFPVPSSVTSVSPVVQALDL